MKSPPLPFSPPAGGPLLLWRVLPPLLLLALVLIGWQVAVWLFRVPPYLLPGPLAVGQGAWQRSAMLLQATTLTGVGAVCGFLASLVLGVLIALLFAQSSVIRGSCYPYAIFLQTVPIVAIAPLVVNWLGSGLHSVVVISCIISLFPVITNVTTGLISVDRGLLDLFRLYRASRWQVLCKLQIPNAVPYLVTGAKTSSGLAVVGAIVGEFFVGYGTRNHGLGYVILYSGPQLKTDQLFAATIASAVLGIVMFSAASLIGRTLLARWHQVPLD
ncbi:MAG: ABC transporter permease [Pirellulaceae bacterium]|nr:ABC transporter permease [Pirellulaceae bacterium]